MENTLNYLLKEDNEQLYPACFYTTKYKNISKATTVRRSMYKIKSIPYQSKSIEPNKYYKKICLL